MDRTARNLLKTGPHRPTEPFAIRVHHVVAFVYAQLEDREIKLHLSPRAPGTVNAERFPVPSNQRRCLIYFSLITSFFCVLCVLCGYFPRVVAAAALCAPVRKMLS
jgi:uncharacterized membrane protein YphA (DoxX/SURF4 family)